MKILAPLMLLFSLGMAPANAAPAAPAPVAITSAVQVSDADQIFDELEELLARANAILAQLEEILSDPNLSDELRAEAEALKQRALDLKRQILELKERVGSEVGVGIG